MMTKRLLFLATAIVLGLIVAYSPQLALADSLVSYAYTGPTYQYMTGGTPYVGQHLSMTFDFSAPLAYSTLWTDVTPLYWSVNDGVNQYSSTTCQTLSCSETFAFSADTNGAITGWSVRASVQNYSPDVAQVYLYSYFGPGCGPRPCGDQVDNVGMTFTSAPHSPSVDAIHNSEVILTHWTMSETESVPEPASLSLLVIGLVGLGFRLRKRTS